MGFIDQLRSEGFAVESICRVLKEQGVKIAARTYRSWRQGRVATRTVSDALVMDAVREIAWKDKAFSDGTPRRVWSSPVEWCNEHSSRMSLATQST